MQRLYEAIQMAAKTDLTVLITGSRAPARTSVPERSTP